MARQVYMRWIIWYLVSTFLEVNKKVVHQENMRLTVCG